MSIFTALAIARVFVKTNWTADALDYDALTDEMYQAIPFFIALSLEITYGIFFNTTLGKREEVILKQGRPFPLPPAQFPMPKIIKYAQR